MSDITSNIKADNVTNNITINTAGGTVTNKSNSSGNSKPRDSSAKIIFEDPILCSQFLKGYLDIPILKNIEPEDIEDVTNRYVHLFTEERNSDVVKKVHIRSLTSAHYPRHNTDSVQKHDSNNDADYDSENADNLPFYIISLIENKSKVDYNVVMQLFRYMVFIWEDYEKEMEKAYKGISKRKDFKYPPILPIVFYDDIQNWTADMQLHDRILLSDVLGEFIPNYRYILMKSSKYSNAELMEHKDELSVLMMLLNLHQISDFSKTKGEVNTEYLEEVFKNTPEYLLNLVAQVTELLLKENNVPEKEIAEFSGQIKERRMGRLFANFESYDVQATRREARAEGVIDSVRLIGGTMETAVQQLMTLYGLNEEDAKEKVKLYW